MIRISLVNDRIYELPESFEVNVSFSDNEPPSPRVSIGQASATVIIVDDDGEFCLSIHSLLLFFLHLSTNFRAKVWTQSNKERFE